jgi:hypothetical protein
MATRNNIKDLFETTPAAIFDSVEELIFQNEKNFKAGRRKQAMQIIGSPGIGKTECLEVYPAKKLAKDKARELAGKLYPELKECFELKKDDGKAESLLIAEYIRRHANG